MKQYYLLVAALIMGVTLSAQSNLRGLFVNLDGQLTSLRYDDADWAAGARGYGFNAKLGYGLGSTTVFVGTGLTFAEGNAATRFGEDYRIRNTELGARVYFTSDPGTVVAYAEIAGHLATSEPYTGIRTRGGGMALAPGLLVYLGEHVALDARVRVAGTYVYDVQNAGIDLTFPGEDYTYATAGFHLGVTFYPSVRRARYRFERGGGHL